jgi:hypothetical protein|tara:strand:- start:309 stop:545 length:237 start_codon:yes stop_codon:yes gene_type:complete
MKKKENMPSWAYWGLYGINSRKVCVRFFIASLILFIPMGIYAIITNSYSNLIFLLVPLYYWYSLKWADNNSAWEESKN